MLLLVFLKPAGAFTFWVHAGKCWLVVKSSFQRGSFEPNLVDKDDGCKNQGNAVSQTYRQIGGKYPKKKPKQGPECKKGIHGQGDAGCVFCLNGFDGLRNKRSSGAGCCSQSQDGNCIHDL